MIREFLYYVFFHTPGVITTVFYALVLILAVFFTLVFGSFRWWWVKRTRLPEMWKRQREEYEDQIKALRLEVDRLEEENGRLKTAAFGEVIMTFKAAVQEKSS